MITAAIDVSRDAIVAAIQGKPVEDIINAADERMSEQEADRSAGQEATNERLERIETAVHSLTSAVVSTSITSTGAIVAASESAGREAREERMILLTNGRIREVAR